MRIIADTHAHTLASGHAYSTISEMARAAAQKGMQVLALTEHAPEMPGTCGLFYFQNYRVLPREMEGIRMLFGAEVNIMDPDGTVDLPDETLAEQDIVVASIHTPCYGKGHSVEENTRAYLNVMKNPHVHIIGHADDGKFLSDYDALVRASKETGTLLELNNSSLSPTSFRKDGHKNMRTILELCKKYRVPVTTGSDAHVFTDAGNFCYVEEVLREVDFPEELVLSTDIEKLAAYIPGLRR